MENKEQALIIKSCEEKLGKDLILLDIRKLTTIADSMVIVSGNSHLQTQAISNEVEKNLILEGFNILGVEGYKDGNWIVIDTGTTIVHIFHKDYRDYYDLEKIWYKGDNLIYKEELHVN